MEALAEFVLPLKEILKKKIIDIWDKRVYPLGLVIKSISLKDTIIGIIVQEYQVLLKV